MAGFSWVNARFGCSVEWLFDQLKMGIERDVDEVNVISKRNALGRSFKVIAEGARIRVSRHNELDLVSGSVNFLCGSNDIGIQIETGLPTPKQIFAYPRLNEKGECRVWVDDRELELWQLREMALGGMFFGA